MKVRDLSILAGVGAPLVLAGPAEAGFVGIKTVSKENQFGLLVCNVYAIFDRPGEDHMVAVAGTPMQTLSISVTNGTFYQHAFGTDKAPLTALIAAFPSLAFDTFVTIGVKAVGATGQPADNLTLTPTWPGFGPSELVLTGDGWAITPDNPQGDPFDPANSFPGNGQVLIGQFSTADGTGIGGTMLIQYVSNGVSGQSVVSFFHVPGPGTAALAGLAGLVGASRRRRR